MLQILLYPHTTRDRSGHSIHKTSSMRAVVLWNKFSTSHGLLHIPQVSTMDLDKIMKIEYPKKKLLSIICSGKNMTWGHQWRQSIATAAKHVFWMPCRRVRLWPCTSI